MAIFVTFSYKTSHFWKYVASTGHFGQIAKRFSKLPLHSSQSYKGK
jgi:hypothetical protein